MSIRELIKKPSEDRVEVVTHEGVEYTLRGRPDATIVGRVIVGEDAEVQKMAKHYSSITKSEFSAENVLSVRMVAATLEHEDDPTERYDETEIALLATKEAGLFFKLMKGASKVLGFSANDATVEAPSGILEAAAGESESGD